MTSSQKVCAHFDVPFVVFPFGGVIVQVLRRVLGHEFGEGDR